MARVPERVPDEDAVPDELRAVEVRGQVARRRAEEDEREPDGERDQAGGEDASPRASAPRVPGMVRTAALALAFLALMAGPAQATDFQVVVVPGFTLDDLESVQDRGAVGLLNPGAGPETSAAARPGGARPRRGAELAARRRRRPARAPLRRTRASSGAPTGPAIYVGLPEGGRQPNDARYPILVVGPGTRASSRRTRRASPGSSRSWTSRRPRSAREDALGSEPAGDAVGRAPRPRRADRRRTTTSACPRRSSSARSSCVLAVVRARGRRARLRGGARRQPRPRDRGRLGLLGGARRARARRRARRPARSPGSCARPSRSASFLVGRRRRLPGRPRDRRRRPSRSRRSGPRRTRATSGSRTSSRRCCSCPRSRERRSSTPRSAGRPSPARHCSPSSRSPGNRFGADGGGAIVLAAGFAVLAVLLAGGGRRALALAVGASLVLALGLIGLDAATGGSSHVTVALEDGPVGLGGDLVERVELSWERATASRVDRPRASLVPARGLRASSSSASSRRPEPLDELAVPLSLAAAIGVSHGRQRLADRRPARRYDRLRRRGRGYASRAMARVAALLRRSRRSGRRSQAAAAARTPRPTPETVIGEVPTETETAAGRRGGATEGDPAAGKEVFASAGCGSCHTLSDAGSTGHRRPEPRRVERRLRRGAVTQITNGGGGMPAFSGTLSEEEIANVAAYVVSARG